MHFPVGEELRRLERAMSAQKTISPEGPGADSVSIPFRLTDGAVAVSAARFFAPNPGFGSMVWMALTRMLAAPYSKIWPDRFGSRDLKHFALVRDQYQVTCCCFFRRLPIMTILSCAGRTRGERP